MTSEWSQTLFPLCPMCVYVLKEGFYNVINSRPRGSRICTPPLRTAVKRPMDAARVAVVGAGVMGLSTALCISKLAPRCSVTVIADKFSPDTMSDVAAGILIPHTYPGQSLHRQMPTAYVNIQKFGCGYILHCVVLDLNEGAYPKHRHYHRFPFCSTLLFSVITDTPVHKQKQWFRETFDHLFAVANSAEAGEAGVHLVSGWQIFRSIPTEEAPFWADVVLGFRKMTEAELRKFPEHASGQAFTTLKCEGSAYLPWLQKRVKESGGLMVTRRIEDLWELHPSFDIVVNCSGLGSRQLAGDSEIFPVRGQVLKVQAPWVKHFIRDGSGLTYVYPGTFNVTLGGCRQKGDWNLTPDAEMSRDILSRCCALEPSLQGAWDIQEKVGLRPSRAGVRLQTELLARDGRRLPVVHHYGHGGGGFCMHWGTALEATRLLSECVQTLRTPASKSKL
ncbi:D-aspartate oxidase [Phyllostomus discolor]|uniref:D-aspartate oxidase n=2 Tax=Phyllostomus discolor TaxID=89673 RepID=A0A834AFD4_9CHIR|nr:D-aspartate oxidase [Phyllostomus discolor]